MNKKGLELIYGVLDIPLAITYPKNINKPSERLLERIKRLNIKRND